VINYPTVLIKYRSLTNNLNVGVYRNSTGPKGRFIEVNPAFLSMFGYKSKSELSEIHVADLYKNPDDRNKFRTEILKHGFVKNWEVELVKKDGTPFFVSASAVAVRDKFGRALYFDGIVEDLSLRTNMESTLKQVNESLKKDIVMLGKAENALIEKEERYRALFDLSPTCILLEDDQGNIIEVNPAFANSMGYEAQELIGKNIRLLAHPDAFEQIDENINKIFSGKQLKHIVRNLKKDGTEVFMELNERIITLPDGKKGIICVSEDITEQLNSEKELSKQHVISERQREFNEALLSAIPIPVFYKDADGKYLGCNKAFAEQLGVSQLEIYGKTAHEVWNTEHARTYHERDMDLLKSAKKQEYEWKVVDKNSNDRHVIFSKDVFRDEKGNVAGIVGTYMDITEREQTETALKESEEKFRIMAEEISDGISITVDGINYWMNKAFAGIFGYEKAELENKSTEFVIATECISDFNSQLQDRLKSANESSLFEITGKKKDGSRITIEVNTKLIDFENKKAVLLVIRDISRRKSAEKAMLHSETSYRGLFNSTSDAIYIQDKNGVFQDVNEGAIKMYGYPREELIGKTPEFLSPPGKNDLEKTLKHVELAFQGMPQKFEFWGLAKNGRVFPKEVKLNKGYYFGKEVIIAFAQDITERKLTEQHLMEAKEKAEESDRLKSAFLANMSHEIRTPMNAMIGFTQLLTEFESNPEERENYISLIQGSCNDLLGLIDDIIDISKIEAGQFKIFKSDYFVDNILSDLSVSFIEYLKTKEDKKHLQIIYKKPDDLQKVIVHTDYNRIKQIFRNLISNAIKFTDKGSIEFGYYLEKIDKITQIKFYIKDTGIGIPEEKVDLVFESFRQVHQTKSRIYGGTGLGLAISKKLVELLGGKIWVESTFGKGSTFYFSMPYKKIVSKKDVPSRKPEKRTSVKYQWNNKKILVVEDNDQSYIFFEKILLVAV